jgi:hypothetical protein
VKTSFVSGNGSISNASSSRTFLLTTNSGSAPPSAKKRPSSLFRTLNGLARFDRWCVDNHSTIVILISFENGCLYVRPFWLYYAVHTSIPPSHPLLIRVAQIWNPSFAPFYSFELRLLMYIYLGLKTFDIFPRLYISCVNMERESLDTKLFKCVSKHQELTITVGTISLMFDYNKWVAIMAYLIYPMQRFWFPSSML